MSKEISPPQRASHSSRPSRDSGQLTRTPSVPDREEDLGALLWRPVAAQVDAVLRLVLLVRVRFVAGQPVTLGRLAILDRRRPIQRRKVVAPQVLRRPLHGRPVQFRVIPVVRVLARTVAPDLPDVPVQVAALSIALVIRLVLVLALFRVLRDVPLVDLDGVVHDPLSPFRSGPSGSPGGHGSDPVPPGNPPLRQSWPARSAISFA